MEIQGIVVKLAIKRTYRQIKSDVTGPSEFMNDTLKGLYKELSNASMYIMIYFGYTSGLVVILIIVSIGHTPISN